MIRPRNRFYHLVPGLPPDKKEFFKTAKTEISYQQNGDEWEIHVGMQGVPNHRTFRFKLGEPYESADLDGSPMKVCLYPRGYKCRQVLVVSFYVFLMRGDSKRVRF